MYDPEGILPHGGRGAEARRPSRRSSCSNRRSRRAPRTRRAPPRRTARRWAPRRSRRRSGRSASPRTRQFHVAPEARAYFAARRDPWRRRREEWQADVRRLEPRESRRSPPSGRQAFAGGAPDLSAVAFPAFKVGEVARHPVGERQGAQRRREGRAEPRGRLRGPRARRTTRTSRTWAISPGRRPRAATSTSACASTAWARSRTAWPTTAACGRSARRSWSSRTTCAGSVRVAAIAKLPVDLRLHPRLDLRRRGRAHARAGRAPRGAAGDPERAGAPPRRRRGDRGGLAHGPRPHGRPDRARADPAGAHGVRQARRAVAGDDPAGGLRGPGLRGSARDGDRGHGIGGRRGARGRRSARRPARCGSSR